MSNFFKKPQIDSEKISDLNHSDLISTAKLYQKAWNRSHGGTFDRSLSECVFELKQNIDHQKSNIIVSKYNNSIDGYIWFSVHEEYYEYFNLEILTINTSNYSLAKTLFEMSRKKMEEIKPEGSIFSWVLEEQLSFYLDLGFIETGEIRTKWGRNEVMVLF